MRLQERDDERDDTIIYWNRLTALLREGDSDDLIGTGRWFFAGEYSTNTSGSIDVIIDSNSLPGEGGNEEWYLAVIAFPDIFARTTYSTESSLNLA